MNSGKVIPLELFIVFPLEDFVGIISFCFFLAQTKKKEFRQKED